MGDEMGSRRCTFAEIKELNGVDDGDIDEVLFQIYRKEKIKQMRTELGGSVLNEVMKAISDSKGNRGVNQHEHQQPFAHSSPKYFYEVISSLSGDQQKVINDNGFGSLLLYENCIVPQPFVTWIAQHIDVRTSEIFVKNNCIPFSKMTIHKILGQRIGGDALISDREAGKSYILAKFNLIELPTVKFFGDKIKNKEILADDELFICFLVVALCCFLCPNSNGLPSPKYMTAFKDLSCVAKLAWSLFIYECLIEAVSTCTGSIKSDKPIDEPGGCSYLLVVMYLDCLSFGNFDVPREIPRISVWKGSMIKFYSDLDEVKENKYGKRCFRDEIASAVDGNLSQHSTYAPSRLGFRPRLEALFGRMLNKQFVDGICEIFDAHCSKIPRKQQRLSENLIFALFKLLDDLTPDGVIQSDGDIRAQEPNIQHSVGNDHSGLPKSKSCGENEGHDVANLLNFNKEKEKLPNDDSNKENLIPVNCTSKGNSSVRVDRAVSFLLPNNAKRTNDDVGCSRNDCFIVPKKPNRPKKSIGVGSKATPFDIDRLENDDYIADPHPKKLCVDKSHPHVEVKVVDVFPNSVSSTPNSFISLEEIEVEACVGDDSFDNNTHKSDVNLKPQIAVKSPDVVFVKEERFIDRLKLMCDRSDKLYNKASGSLKQSCGGFSKDTEALKIDVQHKPFSKDNEPGETDVEHKTSPSMSVVNDEDLVPSKVDVLCADPPCLDSNAKFSVTPRERRNYAAVCKLACSRTYSKVDIIDIGGCKIKFFSLGDSMAPGGKICTYIINCLCRKFFLDERPTISLKHYFFSSLSDILMSDSDDYSYIEKCFNGASRVLALPLCENLFFPVLYNNHWFLFVVDLKNKWFLFLDSYYSKDDEYSVVARRKLIPHFRSAWNMFVGSDAEWQRFRIGYPHVPKQQNTLDCGIFVIKYMELWKFGCQIKHDFSHEDIPNIRIQILNDLLLSQHNKSNRGC
ncbi:unnamed protein product [Urochloa decumbens]|uniref:Ubiquitin-like protease family profile domain-containing protein n=1 Tax=Urochloa decumbens TaxID=240449 RepID=A0ABC9BFQ9_9POAL